MPAVLIEVRKQYAVEQEIALVKAVHAALQTTFKISDHAINVRLWTHQPHCSSLAASLTHPELFTFVTIDCIEGRTIETKRNLYRCIIQSLETLGIPHGHIKILLRETSKENWCTLEGQAACDVDLGYSLLV